MLVIADRIPASRLQAFTAAAYLNRFSEEAASACETPRAAASFRAAIATRPWLLA